MTKKTAVSMSALILCLGMFTAASASAQPVAGTAHASRCKRASSEDGRHDEGHVSGNEQHDGTDVPR